MLINLYLKLARKNLLKNKFHSFINILGLSLGLCCSIIIYQFIYYNLSFDSYYKNGKSIYRVVTDLHLPDGSMEYDSGTPLTMADNLKGTTPLIVGQTVALTGRSLVISNIENGANSTIHAFSEKQNVAFTNTQWFEIFNYHWLQGDKNNALNEPDAVVLTKREALKYFGSTDAIGKSLLLDNKLQAIVKGVINDYPPNTDNKIDIFISLPAYKRLYPDKDSTLRSNWGIINSSTWTYLLLKKDASPDLIDHLLRGLTQRNLGDVAQYYKFRLESLKSIHLDLRYGGAISWSMLTVLFIIGLFILIIACVNFINLSTAQVLKRSREVGTLKVFGSKPSDIFWQFITETTMITLIAAFIAFCGALLFLPILNDWLQINLALTNSNLFLVYSCIVVLVIFTSGFYPSLILSRFTPLNAIKDKVGNHSWIKNWGVKALVVTQNTIAQILIISTVIITLQVRYLNNTDLGFNKEGVFLVPVPYGDNNDFSVLRNRLGEIPDIKRISFCYGPPSDKKSRGGQIKFDNGKWSDFSVESSLGDAGYLKTFGLQLLAGRNISANNPPNQALVNMELVHKLRFGSPRQILGHNLVIGDLNGRNVTIVGVVKNFQIKSLDDAIGPDIIATDKGSYQYMAVRLNGNSPMSTIASVNKIWKSIYPKSVFEYQFLDDRIASLYSKEDLLNKLIKASALIAIFISCLGLLGLVSLTIVHRTKEMTIRKILGASSLNIAGIFMSDFVKLILIAMLFAFPAAWYLMNKWLDGYAYRIKIEWWVFIYVALSVLLITIITIGYQIAKCAKANLIKNLKTM
jgi:putative ABC transport system permease protein